MNNQTLEKLRQMRLFGMHDAFKTSLENTIKEKMTQDQFVSNSVIYSDYRMTYTAVREILEDKTPELLEKYAEIVPMLEDVIIRFLDRHIRRSRRYQPQCRQTKQKDHPRDNLLGKSPSEELVSICDHRINSFLHIQHLHLWIGGRLRKQGVSFAGVTVGIPLLVC